MPRTGRRGTSTTSASIGQDAAAAYAQRGGLVGTPEQIVERLREMEPLGMSYAITYFAEAAYDRSGVELFAREVIPALA